MSLDKRTFKICEAVHLGLSHYYMGCKDRREVTEEERNMANRIIPTLPPGWWKEPHNWDTCKSGWDNKRFMVSEDSKL